MLPLCGFGVGRRDGIRQSNYDQVRCGRCQVLLLDIMDPSPEEAQGDSAKKHNISSRRYELFGQLYILYRGTISIRNLSS